MREPTSTVRATELRRGLHRRASLGVLVGLVLAIATATLSCSGHDATLSVPDGSASPVGTFSGNDSAGTFGGNAVGGDGGPFQAICAADAGQSCATSCSGGPATFSGTVYDPAGQSPLYNVAVYVPKTALPNPLPAGPSCDCTNLYPAEVAASAVTDANGQFVLQNAPAGTAIPLVVQAGKWRREYTVTIASGCANAAPDKSLRLPRNSSEGNLPDLAISTGGADSLECLPLRIGVDAKEYVPGAGSAGHIHIFSGYAGAVTATATPQSYEALWDSAADLMKNDVVLLSCEGEETSNVTAANQQALVDYTTQGGRVFASHYQYVWLALGPFGNYPLARWTSGPQIVVTGDNASVPANVVTTLPNGQVFPEGQALQQWLTNVGALANGQLPIWYARHNADALSSSVSQSWITLDPSVPAPNGGALQYLSFDTPLNASQTCGRVVYSDLHVSGGPGSDEPGVPPDYPDAGVIGTDRKGGIVPSGCAAHPLTPQEKALEFMLFDLSSCLVDIGDSPQPIR
jgi:hypothetical protein